MRTVLAPFFWFGRVLLWIFLFPVGVWRSLRHHRRKGTRKAVEQVRREMKNQNG